MKKRHKYALAMAAAKKVGKFILDQTAARGKQPQRSSRSHRGKQPERESLELIRKLAAKYGLEMEVMHSSDYTQAVDFYKNLIRAQEER